MRIATWNVNSLSARMPAVEQWLARAQPDVLLMQETKLADEQVPELPFRVSGYEVVHHGEGRWNGVAIASKFPLTSVVTNFGDGTVRDSRGKSALEEDFNPFDEARMLSVETGGIRFVSIYAPNGRQLDTPFYEGKLAWFERMRRWLDEARSAEAPLLLGGDFNATPADIDVWEAAAAHGGTHVSPRERDALRSLREWGLIDLYRSRQDQPGRFTWWDYRAGMFHKNKGMRIDLLYGTEAVARRVVGAEIDREARKGPPTPSDHAPVVVDLDQPGPDIDPDWDAALARIATRQRK